MPLRTLQFQKLVKAFAIVILGVMVLAVVSAYITIGVTLHDREFYTSLVLHSTKPPPANFDLEPIIGVKKQVFWISSKDSSDSKMYAWLFKNPAAKKLVVINHGAGGDILFRIHIAQTAYNSGCSALLYDYRGYGLSDGKRSLDSIFEDGLTVYDFCREKLGYSADQIVVYGESIGTAVTCNVAQKRQVDRIVLQSGVTTLPEVGRYIFPWLAVYPDFVFPQTQIDNVKSVKQVHVPILFIHGLLDAQVPNAGSKKMYEAANEPKKLILLPEAGHDDVGRKDAKKYAEVMQDFLNN